MRTLAVVVAVLLEGPAYGQSPIQEAEERVEIGLRYYRIGEYRKALEEWEKAYGLSPDTNTLFAIGQAHRKLGDCRTALEKYRRVLAGSISGSQRNEVRRVVVVCEKKLQEEPPPAPASPPAAAPGPAAEPTPEPAPPPPAESRPWHADSLGRGLVIGGAAGLAAGSIFLIMAERAESAAADQQDYTDFLARLETADRNRAFAVGAFVIGTALVGVGVVRFATARRTDEQVAVGASISGDGTAWLLVTGPFR